MFEKQRPEWLTKITQEDISASILRVALSTAGPFGVVIGEFITHVVPHQRLDRLHELIELLNQQGSEEAFEERLKSSPAFSALSEEAILSAVKTQSSQRRRDLAELLKTGLTKSDVQLIDHVALLKVLDAINESQILILMAHGFSGGFNDPDRNAFYEKHQDVVQVDAPCFGDDDPDKHRQWAMYEHYVNDLVVRGLLTDREGVIKSGIARQVEITATGELLLDAINRLPKK